MLNIGERMSATFEDVAEQASLGEIIEDKKERAAEVLATLEAWRISLPVSLVSSKRFDEMMEQHATKFLDYGTRSHNAEYNGHNFGGSLWRRFGGEPAQPIIRNTARTQPATLLDYTQWALDLARVAASPVPHDVRLVMGVVSEDWYFSKRKIDGSRRVC